MLVARYAARKGHSRAAFLVGGLVISWIVTFIIALLIEDRTAPRRVMVEGQDRVDRLTQLANLRESGALTIEEFEAEKARLLNE